MEFQSSLFGRKCANILPSPPESPSMYAYPPVIGELGWYTTRLASRHLLPAPCINAKFRPAKSARQSWDEKASASEPQENSPCDKHTPPQSSSLHQMNKVESSNSMSTQMTTPELPAPDQVSHHIQKEDFINQRPTPASSTVSHPPPQLVLTEADHQSDGDELFTGSEEEEDVAGGTEPVKSSAERLAEKRKMKRFRLTHAQTRYLTSEFSRQPHPDAVQRERLSRDIPGLNPRQVQVWFQNRRAKIKRLTTDDQERMRRSRALPEGFDFSKTLRPVTRENRHLYESASTDPLMFGGGISQRPSLRLGMGHLSTASNSMYSSFTNHTPSPISTTGSANPSPVSSLNEGSECSGSCYSTAQSPLITSPQFAKPFGRSHSLSVDSPALHRQGQPSGQSSMIGLGGQAVATKSPSSSSLIDNTYAYGSLPSLQFIRTPLQTRDSQHFNEIQNTDGPSHENGTGMSQQYTSTLSSPSRFFSDQSQLLHPSDSGFRASSYCQSSETTFWQGSQMSPQGYQYEQRLQPRQTSEQRCGSESWQGAQPQDPLVNRYDQRSYSHSGEKYRAVSASDAPQFQQTFLGAGSDTGRDRRPWPDAARPRAMSDTFPAYYNLQR